MLATPRVSAFTDSPRNIPASTSKQGITPLIQSLLTGARLKKDHLYNKKLPALQGV
ncbi:hypothetical protein GXM_10395 [Nostoc sphaeroides CCNUC1]|uniref:Uncharacterized protein n=1 Tax=Nostoc sphaeroides CCNUC1 TaxID=2653204 RepID=A0A5P8WJ82_9NOSO|nr:hypothetical protein GXM_10395 [Nostoc sphaeroides CCNUC1]